MNKKILKQVFIIFVTIIVIFSIINSYGFAQAATSKSANTEKSVNITTSLIDGQVFVCKDSDLSTKLNFSVDVKDGAVDENGRPVCPEIYVQSTTKELKGEHRIFGWEEKENNSYSHYRKYNVKTNKWDISINVSALLLSSDMENTFAPYKIRIECKGKDGTTDSIEKQVYAMYKTQFYKPAGTTIVSVEQFSIDKNYYFHPQNVKISMGETVGILLERLFGKDKIKTSYIKQDANLTGLYELGQKSNFLQNGDYGNESQWIVTINGIKVNNISKIVLSDGDVVRIMYSKNGGADVGLSGCNKTDVTVGITKLYKKIFEVQSDNQVNKVQEVKKAILEAKQYVCGNMQTVSGIKEHISALENSVDKIFPKPEINENGNYVLDSMQDLKWMQYCSTKGEQFEGKTFVMCKDIDMQGSKSNIWNSFSSTFRGTINGQGYKIYNVFMKGVKETDCISFFGDIGTDGELINVGIEGQLELSGGAKGAMFAYSNAGLITRCYTSGKIKYGDLFDGAGFIYDNSKTSICTGSQYIKDCYAAVDFVPMDGVVSTKGTASGFTSVISYRGFGKLMNALSLGNIPESIPNRWMFGNERGIESKFGVYEIYGSSHIYENNPATLKQNNSVYCAIGKNYEELKQKTSYIGFNFSKIWSLDPTINNGYPYLQVFKTHEDPSCKSVMVVPIMADKPYDRSEDSIVERVSLTNVENGDQVGICFETASAHITAPNTNACRPGCTDKATVNFKTLYLTGKDADKYDLYPDIDYIAQVKIIENKSQLPYDEKLKAYTISSRKDFETFITEYEKWNSFAGKKIKLMSDINLQGEEGSEWKPIGDKMKVVSPSWCYNDYISFSGEFDGNGHTISGLYFDTNSKFANKDNFTCCFLEKVEDSGIIKNLKLEFTANINEKDQKKNIAALVGNNKGIIYNCAVKGSVNKTAGKNADVFALVNENNGKILNCYADICYDGTLKKSVGKGIIENCYYTGTHSSKTDKNNFEGSKELKYWSLNDQGEPVLRLFAIKDAKPVITLGLDIQLNKKVFDKTTGAAVRNIELIGLEEKDKKNVSLDYNVKSAEYDSPCSGTNKNVTVLFDNINLTFSDPALYLKYELLPIDLYNIKGEILSKNIAPTKEEKEQEIANIKKALYIYYKDLLENHLDMENEYDPTKGTEWTIIDLAYIDEFYPVNKEERQKIDDFRRHYIESLRTYMETHAVPSNVFKSTKYDRILLAMTAMGYDPESFMKSKEEKGSKFDFIGTISNKNFGNDGQFMGKCYGIMAMDSGNYTYPVGSQYTTREECIKSFFPPSHFYLQPNTIVSDFASMPLQAAAPYPNPNWERVISQLSGAQQSQGQFGNIWTTDQVVILLSALGVNLIEDTRFIKDGNSAVDSIINDGFYLDDMKIKEPSLSHQHAEALISVIEVEQRRNGAWWLFDTVKSNSKKIN